eukprot:CAMPEP_0195058750 /NCGR_PEP_ID=MMETSP0448-20130528/6458_1 /TAXON_ID=66468 /ORGANISM="Heterocapsa triquestra, Strain CCMP 448" /LENGTH=557 /DNA_ID=CAMNT_0040088921 /DNA_START=68 /DNA_END=1741 /DNA_ORIENTATION=+
MLTRAANKALRRVSFQCSAFSTQAGTNQPHVAVIGTGLVGLTSANSLRQRGFRVTLIDRQPTVAGECSYANAALLMRSYSRPKTATPLQLLRWATSRSEPVHVSWRALVDPSMTAFGLRFLLSGPQTEKVTQETTQITDRLAQLSIDKIEAVIADRKLPVKMTKGGLLMFFRDAAKLRATVEEAEGSFAPEQRADRFRVISPEECVELEPTLAKQKDAIVGGVFWHPDQTVCPLAFSKQLAASLAAEGVQFMLGEEVVALDAPKAAAAASSSTAATSARVRLASGQELVADAVVLAAGVGTGALLRKLGPSDAPPVPLYGMRGHSVTVDASHLPPVGLTGHVLKRSVCDADNMVFFSPLPHEEGRPDGHRLVRVAAFGDFDGWGYGPESIRPWRMKQLLSVAKRNLGEDIFSSSGGVAALAASPALPRSSLGDQLCPDVDPATRWCGLRPMSPDGLPVVGAVGSVGAAPIFINAGHGALGWTLSAGTGEVLAQAVAASLGRSAEAAEASASGAEPSAELATLAAHLEPSRFRWPEVVRRAFRMYFGRATEDGKVSPA